MISVIEQILGRPPGQSRRNEATAVDIVGLCITLATANLIAAAPEEAALRTFVVTLVAFGVLLRLFVGRIRSIATVLHRPNQGLLLVPLATALCAILVHAVGRSYYSVTIAGIFTLLWTLWILVHQLLVRRLQGPLRILLIDPAPFRAVLDGTSGVEVSVYSSPPAGFSEWDLVVIDPARLYSQDWYAWLAYADMYGTRSLSAPLVLEELTGKTPTNLLVGEWPHAIFAPRTDYVRAKRYLDFLAILFASPLLVPAFVIVSVLVLICDGRPVFFRQTRVGYHGKPFSMLKYRTMREGDDPEATSFARENDDRITKLGRFLRRRRLDELPQVLNVLRGEMSLIGPRPEQLNIATTFEEEILTYGMRHNVRPGISGWAQVKQGYVDSVNGTREKLSLDLYYVRHCSMMLDLRIALRTLRTVITGFGAR